MGIGDRLLDTTYHPNDMLHKPDTYDFTKIIRCPVTFTHDPIEYAESFIEYKLKPVQKTILEDLFQVDANGQPIYNHAVFIAGMRCLGLGTEVLMYDGSIKKVEDIVVGELVMGPDNNQRRVLSTNKGSSELYNVRQSSAMTYVVNESHILSLKERDTELVVNIPIKKFNGYTKKCKSSYMGYTAKTKFSEETTSYIKIKYKGFGDYAGITVDGDNLYCLSDGTVTHNSGKSILAGIIGSFLLQKLLELDNPGKDLGQAPNQKFIAEYIATSEQQTKQTAYATFENIILNSKWWRKYVGYLRERETKEGKETLFQQHARKILFPEKNLEGHSLHSNSSSIAGFTAFFVCFDEMSRFDISEGDVQQKTEKRTAQAVYYTASRAAKTLRQFSKIVTVTSPMYETDFGMQLLYMAKEVKAGPSTAKTIEVLRSRYTKRVDDVIGYHFCTYEANPRTEEDPYGYVEKDFEVEKAANYSTFLRDYMALPPSAISPFFELPERVDRSVNPMQEPIVHFTDDLIVESVGAEVRKYIGKKIQILNSNRLQKYFICCDQGAVKDSFVVAMGHATTVKQKVPDARGGETETLRHKVIIDFVEAWKPDKEERITVSFTNVEEVIKILNSYFYIDRVVYDQWHSTESIERLFSEGMVTKKLTADIEMYETLKVLIYSGMVELPANEVLLTELRQLNVIKGRKVEHPSEGSKDMADAVCRTAWCIYLDSIRDSVHGNFMLPMGQTMSTVRSVVSASELMRRSNIQDEVPFQHYGIFGRASSSGRGVFGKSMIVQPNVIPTIGDNKLS